MSILQNAIESIQIGVEDFNSSDKKRYLSSIRNVTAGLLLLYKQKLCELSPQQDNEVLIKKDIRPFFHKGILSFKGQGKKTVDVYDIKERFKTLGVKIDTDVLDKIINLRNEIEHYYTGSGEDVIRELLAKCFILIRDFIVNELNNDPLTLLGEECWQKLLNIAEVYENELKICQDFYKKIDWEYESITHCLSNMRCIYCHSELIKAEQIDNFGKGIQLTCSECNNFFDFEEILEDILGEEFASKAYEAMKYGEEPPIESCPECLKDTFVLNEGCCVGCGYQKKFKECWRCGEAISIGEQEYEGLCGYCQHQSEKMMNE